MKVKYNEKEYERFKKESNKKTNNSLDLKYFCMYVQMAESCDNGLVLSRQPWKFSKFHKLSGNMSNLYSFGISKSKRTLSYAQDKKALPLNEVVEMDIYKFSEDYH